MQARLTLTPKATRLDRLRHQRRIVEQGINHLIRVHGWQADHAYLNALLARIDATIAEVEA